MLQLQAYGGKERHPASHNRYVDPVGQIVTEDLRRIHRLQAVTVVWMSGEAATSLLAGGGAMQKTSADNGRSVSEIPGQSAMTQSRGWR
jgi:hypothetical protein